MSYVKIKVLSFNIHKGFNWNNSMFTLGQIRQFIRESEADLVFLQELHGKNTKLDPQFERQLEYLADSVWDNFSYGKNAIYDHGDHGNAILSKFPMTTFHNFDLSLHPLEKRGLLHTMVEIPNKPPLHLLCTHLNLLHRHRKEQYEMMAGYIEKHIKGERLILAGDFNDWNWGAGKVLENKLGLKEVFKMKTGHYAKTFPWFHPMLNLDRIYIHDLHLLNAGIHIDHFHLSDHLPISCEIHL